MSEQKKQKSLAARFVQNTGWQVINQIYSMLLSLIIGALAARYLGPSNYGLIGYGHSFVSIFTAVSSLGMNAVVVKDLVKKPEERSKIVGTALVLRIVSSLLCVAMIDLLVCVIKPGEPLLRFVTFLQSIALILNATEAFSYWFQSKLQYKYISIASMIAYTAVGAWRIVLLSKGTTVEWFSLSSCVQYFVTGLILVIAFFGKEKGSVRFEFATAKSILSRSYHFILSGVAIALYTQVDKLMLGSMLNETVVGYYTAATTLATMWEFVPNAIINSSKVVVFDSKGKDEEAYQTRLSYMFAGISFLSILVSIAFTIFGNLAVYLLYGKDYMAAVVPLSILIWSTGFAMIGTARGSTWLVAENLNKYAKYYVLISSAVNIALNAWFIPMWGMVGAAVATLISQIVTAFGTPMLFRKTRPFVSLYLRSFGISIRGLKAIVEKRKSHKKV